MVEVCGRLFAGGMVPQRITRLRLARNQEGADPRLAGRASRQRWRTIEIAPRLALWLRRRARLWSERSGMLGWQASDRPDRAELGGAGDGNSRSPRNFRRQQRLPRWSPCVEESLVFVGRDRRPVDAPHDLERAPRAEPEQRRAPRQHLGEVVAGQNDQRGDGAGQTSGPLCSVGWQCDNCKVCALREPGHPSALTMAAISASPHGGGSGDF